MFFYTTGLITRQEAEILLNKEPVGSFLVRISERIWGYAITYKDFDCCKHYLVDASNGHYQFLGTNQMSHKTLSELFKNILKNNINYINDNNNKIELF